MRTLTRMVGRHAAQGSLLRATAISAAGLAAVALVDLATGPDLSLSVFYLGPISFFAWRAGLGGGIVASVVGAATWYMVDDAGGRFYAHPLIPVWNSLVRLAFFIIVCALLVSHRQAVQHEISLARTDPLTGLFNRRAFEELAIREIERAARLGSPLSFVYIDLDDFKAINDQLGHAAGDQVLHTVARVMDLVMRGIDIKARLGGDEFALALPDTDEAAATRAIERLSSVLTATGVPASIGTVVYETPPPSVGAALEAVDAVMYDVKQDPSQSSAVRRMVADPSAGSPNRREMPASASDGVEENPVPIS